MESAPFAVFPCWNLTIGCAETDISTSFRQVIDEIRHSVAALHQLPPDVEMRARMVYYEGIRLSFIASSGFALAGFIAALFTRGRGLERS